MEELHNSYTLAQAFTLFLTCVLFCYAAEVHTSEYLLPSTVYMQVHLGCHSSLADTV